MRETFRAADRMARFEDFEGFFDGLWSHYAEATAWRLAAGARQCLDQPRRARSPPRRALELRPAPAPRAHGLGLAERFEQVTLPADAGAAKPERAIFDACLARLGLAPRQVLYVGDHATLDVAAAHAAGWLALDASALPDLSALPAAIDRIEQELAPA